MRVSPVTLQLMRRSPVGGRLRWMAEDGVQGPPGGEVAADLFDVELRPRRSGRLLRGLRVAASVVGGLFMGLLPQPSLSDLVVICRRDGA